ncbi:MAG: sigma-70 family RNA polymerase sigma factor [Planctomycetaceae bacterium]|nr:MAG: sigma-70 family RNA polymerase sigma factor [Planctomycetaceae bacterium]
MSIETRASLLMRLRSAEDTAAWADFLAIYEPVIYRLARARGLQDADAREVTQDVLLAVAGAIHRFDPTGKPRFAGWLARITRNAAIDRIRRSSLRGGGGSDFFRLLEQVPDTSDESSLFELERRRALFRFAAARVRETVSDSSWQAFWATAVEGQEPAGVAKRLRVSVGAVYVARCRVLAKIKTAVTEADE